MTKKKTFDEINSNWENKVVESEDLLGAVGRSQDLEKLKIIVKDLSSKMNLETEDNFLEIGCGTGILLSELSSYTRKSFGIDYSNEAIKKAKKAFPEIEFYAADAANLPFEDNQFDKLLCYSVFHYFGDMDYALSSINEFLRVCKDGGTILIGDLPSKPHFHLSPYYNKWDINYLFKLFLRPIIRLIKRRPKVNKAPIIDPKKWLWFNLKDICKKLKKKGHNAEILEQPKVIQWSEITYNHRFDLRITK